jgi:hypothetical protein
MYNLAPGDSRYLIQGNWEGKAIVKEVVTTIVNDVASSVNKSR